MLSKAKIIMKTLLDNGYSAYIVGGACRDIIIGVEPKDYDIATNAHPDIIENLFDKTIPTGKEYGTITVMIDDVPYEVTTYRQECEYIDGRRPSVVSFSNTIEEDLSRRDLTINAIAMDINGNFINPYNGIDDIKKGLLRFVGNPKDRLHEDKLRALRIIRFACKYKFGIEYNSLDNLYNLNIGNLSAERIRDELNKILLTDEPKYGIQLLCSTGMMNYISKDIANCYRYGQNNPNHNETVLGHMLSVVELLPKDLNLRLAGLFHDVGKIHTMTIDNQGYSHYYGHHKESAKICREVMTNLRYSNKEIEFVSELVYWHMSRYNHLRTPSVKKFINKVGIDKLDSLFTLQIADIQSSKNRSDISGVESLKEECYRIINEQLPLSIKDLCIGGNELMMLGYIGKEIGEQLKLLLDLVIEDESLNNRDKLIEISKRR